jgi:predicted flap endonuclease-1-like 5' DNA nuclease
MNDTSSAAGNAASAASTSSTLDGASLLTTVHLIWLAVFAVVVLLGILYGARLKHRRRHAERRVADHAREAGVEPQPTAEEAPVPSVSAASPAPLAFIDQPTPAVAPPTPAPSIATDADDPANGPVTQLKGLGPKVAARLAELGITSVGQVAALDDDAAYALDAELGAFRGRLERDRWVEQARFLAAGDRAGFEAVFGRL